MHKHDDAGKIQFRIDVAGQPPKRNQTGYGECSCEQKYCPAVIAAPADEVHGLTRTLLLSGKPYPPARMILSPSFRPERTRTLSAVCVPSVTGTNSASSAVSL